MAYRGEDLDLRTPQSWNANPPEAPGGDPYLNGARARGSYTRPTPILVDDIVLACSNHAFDVAVAHRAGEVRIEHLLHAMTRIDGASHGLEARGIRVPGLRRESATIIAAEIPVGLAAGQGRPRRSDDFEQVLRTASAIAYRRNAPANIDDVLDALLDMPSDIPGIALLARHGGRVARDRTIQREQMVTLQPLPPLSRTSTAYTPLPEQRPAEPRAADTRYLSSYRAADVNRTPRNDMIGSATDGIQNARIDQLENAVRALTSEISSDRKSERDDANRFRGGLQDRLQSLEQAVMNVGNDAGRDQLHERMKSLEYAVLDSRKDNGDAAMLLDRLAAVERGLEQRLGELSRPWGVLSERLQALEQSILDTRGTKSSDIAMIQERMAGLERALREISHENARVSSAVTDRLKSMERSVDLSTGKAPDFTPLTSRLDMIEEAVLGQDASNGADKLAERLRVIEEAIAAQRAVMLQSNQALTTDIRSLASALAAQSAGNERVQSFVSDRMQTLMASFERQRAEFADPMNERLNQLAVALDNRMQAMAGMIDRQRSEVAMPILTRLDRQGQEVAGPILERMTGLANAMDGRSGEAQRMMSLMSERIVNLEKQLAFSVQRTAEVQAAHAAELKEVHEALIKLNTNQHTLAGSIDQWRLDGIGDINVIANRLDGIEKTSGRPLQMIEALTVSVDNINRATVERYHRRNRFWYWLFGTDDWLTASWPSQVASVEAERAALRGTVPAAGNKSTQRA